MTATLPRPWLAAKPGEMRGATLLEYVALLGGQPRTDEAACVHPVLAAATRAAGARLGDDPRQGLLGLLGGLIDTPPTGSAHDRKVLDVRLACWCTTQVLPQTRPQDRAICQAAIDTALAWCDGTATERQCQQAAAAAAAAVRAAAAADAAAHAAAAAAAWACPAEHLPAFLAGLVGEHDRLTGRAQRRTITDENLASLAVLAGLSA